MSIKVKLEGFDELLKQIDKAGGSIEKTCEEVIKNSAEIMETQLKTEMKKAGVDNNIINKMPQYQIEKDGNVIAARVGFSMGSYNPKDPSVGYKAVFMNYGTPHRTKHGKIVAKGFIQKAKKNASPLIKKQQQEAIQKILGGLSK